MGLPIGGRPKNMSEAIRLFCLECMGGHSGFVDNRGRPTPAYRPYSAPQWLMFEILRYALFSQVAHSIHRIVATMPHAKYIWREVE